MAETPFTRAGFDGADYGPIRIASLARLEVGVALVAAESEATARFIGLGGLEGLDDAGIEEQTGLHAALARDGATLVMATRLPVRPTHDVSPGRHSQRLIIAGIPSAGPEARATLHTFDGATLRDSADAVVSGVSLLVLDLHVDVPDHR